MSSPIGSSTATATVRLDHARGARRVFARAVRVVVDYAPLPAVLGAAAVLRFWGISSGIPFAPGTDEPVIVSHAVRMMQTGDLNPHFFDYPALVFYIQMIAACARFVVGAIQGQWDSLAQVGPEDFYLWARAVNALLGVATTALVYACGLYWSRTHAVLAAALCAVFPLHVRESHYALTDVPVTFFVAATLLLSLRAAHGGSLWTFAAAGGAAGLAMATKYNAFLALLLPLVAIAGCPPNARVKSAAAALAAAGAFFLLGAPYTLLDLPAFLNGFAALARHYAARPDQEAGWIIYLKHLRLALTSGGMLVLACGVAVTLAGGLRRSAPVRHWLVLVFPVAYFAFVSRHGLIFARYLLPMTPFLALLMAAAIVAIGDAAGRLAARQRVLALHHRLPGIAASPRAALLALVTLLVIWPQVQRDIGFNRQLTRPSTQEAAYRWILDNVPRGSKVISERFEIRLPERHYRMEGPVRLINRRYEDYLRGDADYLIASSYAFGPALDPGRGDTHSRDGYHWLFSQAREVFRVTPDGRLAGPEIRVYAVK